MVAHRLSQGEHATHADLAEAQTGERPVTMEELEADPYGRITEPYIEGENSFERANRLSNEPTTDTTVGDTTYRSKLVNNGEGIQVRTIKNGKEIGSVGLDINPNGEGDDFAISGDLSVNESARGKGVARQMYDNLLNVAKQYGIRTIQGEGVQTEGGKAVWESLVRSGKAYKTVDQYDQPVYRMELPAGETPAQRPSVQSKPKTLVDKVLSQPETHEQSVIDKASELSASLGGPDDKAYLKQEPPKSGRGFQTP